MKKDLLKAIANLFLYLLLVVAWGTSLALWIIEDSEFWLVIWLVSSVFIFISAFFIELGSKCYKLKYYFLGKKFKQQKKEYFKIHNNHSKKEKKQIIKMMKDTYRRYGCVEIIENEYEECIVTPQNLYFDDYKYFDYSNSLEYQIIDFIIYSLYMNILEGGGLYRFFEKIIEEMIPYDEFKNLLTKSNIPDKIKKILVGRKSEQAFKYLEKETELNDEEHKFLEEFELNESNLIFKFEEEIFSIVKEIAINKFYDYHQKRAIPNNAVEVYISNDNLRRISICYSKQLKIFNVIREDFVIYDTNNVYYSSGDWEILKEMTSFATREQALNGIKNEIKDYKLIFKLKQYSELI